jgi:hypothetical protein
MKMDPSAAYVARLEAIMDVLGYGEFGGQKRFADEIGVAYKNFNLQLKGYPLTNTVVRAIFWRFHIPLEFLWFGIPDNLARSLEQQLRDWERDKAYFCQLPSRPLRSRFES